MNLPSFIVNLWYKFRHWQYERKCIKYFGAKPETIYLSKEDFEALQKRLAEPPDPKVIERFRQIMSKPAPWDEEK
jgi:hypothetical protein